MAHAEKVWKSPFFPETGCVSLKMVPSRLSVSWFALILWKWFFSGIFQSLTELSRNWVESAFLSITLGEKPELVFCLLQLDFFLWKTNNNAFNFWDIVSDDFVLKKITPWKYVESSCWTFYFSQRKKTFGLKLTFLRIKLIAPVLLSS